MNKMEQVSSSQLPTQIKLFCLVFGFCVAIVCARIRMRTGWWDLVLDARQNRILSAVGGWLFLFFLQAGWGLTRSTFTSAPWGPPPCTSLAARDLWSNVNRHILNFFRFSSTCDTIVSLTFIKHHRSLQKKEAYHIFCSKCIQCNTFSFYKYTPDANDYHLHLIFIWGKSFSVYCLFYCTDFRFFSKFFSSLQITRKFSKTNCTSHSYSVAFGGTVIIPYHYFFLAPKKEKESKKMDNFFLERQSS